MNRFFRVLFGQSGDRTAIPDAAETSGAVSMTQGYGSDYERASGDVLRKDIERDKMNALFYDITAALNELQSHGAPDFITPTLNGGTAYSYSAMAMVRYSGDVYLSLADSNTAAPTDATKWALLPNPARLQSQSYVAAAAGGSANALTASLTPAALSLTGLCLFVRIGSANTVANPTLNVDGLGAVTIVRDNNQALRIGDLPGAGAWAIVKYDATLGRFVLLNPATRGVEAADAQATTSGTYKDFTLPTWAKRCTIALAGVSSSGSSPFCVQFLTASGAVVSGYSSVASTEDGNAASTYSTGLALTTGVSSSSAYDGRAVLEAFGDGTWSMTAQIGNHGSGSGSSLRHGVGSVTLSATPTGVRFTTIGGSDDFDLGLVRAFFE